MTGGVPIPAEDLSTVTVCTLLLAHRNLDSEVVQAIALLGAKPDGMEMLGR